MNSSKSTLAALAVASLLAGCNGTGPNTQQGAVGGAALGALAGAIIGNNSGSHNGAAGAAIGAIAGGVAGGTIGNSLDNERGTLYTSESQATTNVVVDQPPAPPPPQREVVYAAPRPGVVWIPGYYAYDGYQYVWIGGRWMRPRRGYRGYVTPHWQRRGGGYVYVQGYWR
ncbi:MAG: 17 kDa surface antigen [Verrucomicrobia bacterium]|nr:17 kDa surface antigen [Verrucomicrobiota bacterium]